MTPDEFVAQGQAAMLAGEAWLKANGRKKDYLKAMRLHAEYTEILEHYIGLGVVQPLSDGGGKERP